MFIIKIIQTPELDIDNENWALSLTDKTKERSRCI